VSTQTMWVTISRELSKERDRGLYNDKGAVT
jgi:hypothetical protein